MTEWEEAASKAEAFYKKGKEFDKAAGWTDKAVSAVPLVAAGYSLLKCFMLDEGSPTLGEVMEAIEKLHSELGAAITALEVELRKLARLTDDQELYRDIFTFWNAIQVAYEKAVTWVESQSIVPPGDPDHWAAFISAIQPMDEAMKNFLENPVSGSDDYYKRVYVEELLYHYVQPVGGGAELRVMKPDDCPEGSVGRIWDYGMMLPAFLRAIAMRLVVLQAKSPEDYVTGFVHVWDDRLNIRAYATKLWEIHNRIRDNIKVIPRPELWGELTYKALIASGTLPSRWCLRSEVTYGAVECYSGTPKVDVYALNDRPAVPAEQATDAEWQAYYDQCMAYYQLFSWRYDSYSYVRQVQLYHELILPALWNTINSLRALTLDPPLEATEYAREPWFRYLTAFSLRQFFSFLPESMRAGWMAGQPLSLRALLAATGITGQGEPISLRRAFGLDS